MFYCRVLFCQLLLNKYCIVLYLTDKLIYLGSYSDGNGESSLGIRLTGGLLRLMAQVKPIDLVQRSAATWCRAVLHSSH